jgi:hypothetical protein
MLINNPNISRHITHKVHAVPRRSDSGDPSLLSSVPIPTKMHQITTEVNNRNPARSFKPILTYPPTSTSKHQSQPTTTTNIVIAFNQSASAKQSTSNAPTFVHLK